MRCSGKEYFCLFHLRSPHSGQRVEPPPSPPLRGTERTTHHRAPTHPTQARGMGRDGDHWGRGGWRPVGIVPHRRQQQSSHCTDLANAAPREELIGMPLRGTDTDMHRDTPCGGPADLLDRPPSMLAHGVRHRQRHAVACFVSGRSCPNPRPVRRRASAANESFGTRSCPVTYFN